MSSRSLYAVLFILWASLLTAGFVHGRITNRWHSVDLASAGGRLEALPVSFGEWELVEGASLDLETREILQCTGSFQRIYRHRKSGQTVRLAMIVGPGGPTAVHVPEICYSSQDFDQLGDSYRLPVKTPDGTAHEFRGIEFQSKDLMATKLLVCYAWTTGDVWRAPANTRLALAGERVLYKLQLSAPAGSDDNQEDPRLAFLRDFLPFASAHLFSSNVQKQ